MLRIVTFAGVFSMTSVVSVQAQQCLHGPGETPDQAARRREALTATRTINNIQANQPGSANKVYLRHTDLVNSPFAVCASMCDLMAGDRPGGGGLHGRHGGSLAAERRELDFERLPIRVD